MRIEHEEGIAWGDKSHSVLLCVGTDCFRAVATADQWVDATGPLGGRLFVNEEDPAVLIWEGFSERALRIDAEITLEVVDLETGAQVIESTWEPRWEKFRPNGPRCPGVCYTTSLTAD